MITKALYIATLLFCFANIAIAQKVKKPTVRKPVVAWQFAEAEKAWAPFLKDFLKTVKERNKESIRQMISLDIECDGEWSCRCDGFQNNREWFFCVYPEYWQSLDWIFDKSRSGKTRIAKMVIERNTIIRRVTYEHPDTYKFVTFAYEIDRKWRIVSLGQGGA